MDSFSVFVAVLALFNVLFFYNLGFYLGRRCGLQEIEFDNRIEVLKKSLAADLECDNCDGCPPESEIHEEDPDKCPLGKW